MPDSDYLEAKVFNLRLESDDAYFGDTIDGPEILPKRGLIVHGKYPGGMIVEFAEEIYMIEED